MLSPNLLATSVLFVVICLVVPNLSTPNKASRSLEKSYFRKDYSPEKLASDFLTVTPILSYLLESSVTLELNGSSIPTYSPTIQTTVNPSNIPTNMPSLAPSLNPTLLPHENPTRNPSLNPSVNPTTPTELPSISPTISPSNIPSARPTFEPTLTPSGPSTIPTINPTKSPTTTPTVLPTKTPSMNPTNIPSIEPTVAPSRPTQVPTENPSVLPTLSPTVRPTNNPTQVPTKSPTVNPTITPSAPTPIPTYKPTTTPTENPTRRPTTTPTNPPTYFPTNIPTQQPTYPEVDLPDYYNWYYVGINSHTFEVAYIVYFALFGAYSIYSCCCTGRWSQDEKNNFKYYSSIFFAFYWVLFETILLCARMTHLLHLPSGTYRPRFTTGNTMVWLGPEYFTAGPHTRQNAGCPSETDIDHYASYDVCKFLFFPLNAEIMVEGAVKFSVGLGIGLYFLIQLAIGVIDAGMEWNRADDPDSMPMYQIRIISFLLKMTFGCLQAVVLLPVQALQMNPYCAYIETPMSQKQSMCVFKWAAVAIPYGVPMGFGAVILGYLASGDNDNDKNWLKMILGIASFALGVCGGGLIVIYLFAGIPLGIWYKFAAIGNKYLLEGSLLLDVLASSGVYLPALNEALLNLMTVRRQGLEEIEMQPVN